MSASWISTFSRESHELEVLDDRGTASLGRQLTPKIRDQLAAEGPIAAPVDLEARLLDPAAAQARRGAQP